MEQVEDNANRTWLLLAASAVRNLAALSQTPFSTDDVWDYLAERDVASPREPRAMGPVIRRALTAGTIVPAGYTQSRRRHAALIRTYTGATS